MSATVPEPVDLGRAYAPTAPYHKALRELHAALVELDPVDPLPVATESIERVIAWVRDPSPPAG